MKILKSITFALTAVLFCFSLSGCGILNFKGKDIKDAALEMMDNAMRGLSKHVLTRKYRLTGDKKEGENAYTGSYRAEYDDFTGKETLFGATGLNFGEDIKLKVDYDISRQSGECFLFRVCPDGINIISARGGGSVEFEIKSGDNYIIFQGDHYTGELNLTCVETSD